MRGEQRKWTDEELDIILTRYPKEGPKALSLLLDRSARNIANKASAIGIRTIRSSPIERKYLEEFENITKPEIAYFLGYFYADGFLGKDSSLIDFSIVEKDGEEMKELLLKIVPFHVTKSRPLARPNSQITMSFKKSDSNLHKILFDCDLHIKSSSPPTKVLNKIPKHLHHFWWQGYFSGDGCLYLNKSDKNIHPRICFVGPKEQNWDFYQDLCNQLDIKFHKNLEKNKFGEWSKIYIQNIPDCRKFLDYVYKDGCLGLRRKYEKYLVLRDTIKVPNPKTSKFLGVCFRDRLKEKKWYSWITINKKQISLGHHWTQEEAAQARDKYIKENNLDLKLNFNNVSL